MATRCVVVKLPSIRKANIRDMQYDLPFIANQAKFAADPKYITMWAAVGHPTRVADCGGKSTSWLMTHA